MINDLILIFRNLHVSRVCYTRGGYSLIMCFKICGIIPGYGTIVGVLQYFLIYNFVCVFYSFTDDVFAALISVIFIYEPIHFLIETYSHDTREFAAVTSLLLFLTIYIILVLASIG